VLITFTPTHPGTFKFFCNKKLLFFRSHEDRGMKGTDWGQVLQYYSGRTRWGQVLQSSIYWTVAILSVLLQDLTPSRALVRGVPIGVSLDLM
jgi:hypothetical protein